MLSNVKNIKIKAVVCVSEDTFTTTLFQMAFREVSILFKSKSYIVCLNYYFSADETLLYCLALPLLRPTP